MDDEWLSSSETIKLAREVMSLFQAPRAICKRAFDGLIETRGTRVILGTAVVEDGKIPSMFWWAEGEDALTQNWQTGDFETFFEKHMRWRAYGVQFRAQDVMEMLGISLKSTPEKQSTFQSPAGRPAAAWWDDLWIEICRQLYEGDLKPTRQIDIERAMQSWASSKGHEPASSTIRERARKLWTAIGS